MLNVMLNVMYPPQVAELTATHSTRLHVPDQEISAMSRMAQVVPAPQKLKPTESDIRVIRDQRRMTFVSEEVAIREATRHIDPQLQAKFLHSRVENKCNAAVSLILVFDQ